MAKRHRQKRVAVARVPAQSGFCQVFRATELLLETGALSRVGVVFFARGEDRVVFIELRFQHAEPVEFRKQNACRLAHRSHGIPGIEFLPRLEFFLRAGKIQIVEPAESAIKPRRRQLASRQRNRRQQDESR